MKNAIRVLGFVKDSFRSFAEKVEHTVEKFPSISVNKDLSGSTVRFDWPGWWKQMKMKNDDLCGIEADNWPGHYCAEEADHKGYHKYV